VGDIQQRRYGPFQALLAFLKHIPSPFLIAKGIYTLLTFFCITQQPACV